MCIQFYSSFAFSSYFLYFLVQNFSAGLWSEGDILVVPQKKGINPEKWSSALNAPLVKIQKFFQGGGGF